MVVNLKEKSAKKPKANYKYYKDGGKLKRKVTLLKNSKHSINKFKHLKSTKPSLQMKY